MIGNKILKAVQIQILSLYKQTNVYTSVIEISIILIKQSLIDLQAF